MDEDAKFKGLRYCVLSISACIPSCWLFKRSDVLHTVENDSRIRV